MTGETVENPKLFAKAEKKLAKAQRRLSSKTCSACQHVLDSLSLDVRSWICPECGTCHDRDINAAHTILAAGLAVHACGGRVRPVRAKARQASACEAGTSHS